VSNKPVIPRALATHDVEQAIDYHLVEGGAQVALGFVDALEKAHTHIGRFSATGSSRYANDCNLPGLCCWTLSRYPYLIFYVERIDHIDVWRVLHGQRDIPLMLQEQGLRCGLDRRFKFSVNFSCPPGLA
jgi:toxin ParE1/3/4